MVFYTMGLLGGIFSDKPKAALWAPIRLAGKQSTPCIGSISGVGKKLLGVAVVILKPNSSPRSPKKMAKTVRNHLSFRWVCLKMGYTPNEIAIFHRDNDQQNHWVKRGTLHFQTNPGDLRRPMVGPSLLQDMLDQIQENQRLSQAEQATAHQEQLGIKV